ncbi:MAG: thermonuclease family protein, partial [Fuerstiella sp.]
LLVLFIGCAPQASPVPQNVPVPAETTAGSPELGNAAEGVTEPVRFKVIKIIDGDTIDVLTDDKETIRLRFNGIDTPERGQPFGNNATEFVRDTVGGKMVRLVTHGEDRYDRTIADIYLAVDDPLVELPDLFLNRELVRRGLAWHYKEYSDDKRLAHDEDNARSKKLGLWGGSHKPIAPWDWRKLSKEERDEYR